MGNILNLIESDLVRQANNSKIDECRPFCRRFPQFNSLRQCGAYLPYLHFDSDDRNIFILPLEYFKAAGHVKFHRGFHSVFAGLGEGLPTENCC